MNPTKSLTTPIRSVLIFNMMLFAGCSSSSDSQPVDVSEEVVSENSVVLIASETEAEEQPSILAPTNTPTNTPTNSPTDLGSMGESSMGSGSTVENSLNPDSSEEDSTSAGNNMDDSTTDGGTTDGESILNSGNANAVILQAFEVYSGRAYDHRLVAFPYEQRYVDMDRYAGYESQDCQSSGLVTREHSAADQQYNNSSFYDNCNIDGDTLNGDVSFIQERNEIKYKREFDNNFSVSFAPDGLMSVEGVYEYEPSISYIRDFSVSGFNYKFSFSAGELTVLNANTKRVFGTSGYSGIENVTSYMSGSFTMLPPALNGNSANVSITESFSNSNDAMTQLAYEQGVMEIIAEDSTIVLDASTGDLQTVQVTVTPASGVSQTTTENWSTWYGALSYILPNLNERQRQPAPTGDGGTITDSNYKQILEEVFGVITGDKFGEELLKLPDYSFPEFPENFYDTSLPEGLQEEFTLSCDNGGSVALAPYRSGARQITTGWNANFTDCARDGQTNNGKYNTRYFGNFNNSSSGIVIESESVRTEFSGSFYYKPRANSDGSPQRQYSLNVATYEKQNSSELESLSNANLFYSYTPPYVSTMSGYFYLSSSRSTGALMRVTTADPLLFDQRGGTGAPDPTIFNKFQSGTLVIDAGNNNSLKLDANTADIETFTLTLVQPNKAPIKVTEQWDDWIDILAFNFDLNER